MMIDCWFFNSSALFGRLPGNQEFLVRSIHALDLGFPLCGGGTVMSLFVVHDPERLTTPEILRAAPTCMLTEPSLTVSGDPRIEGVVGTVDDVDVPLHLQSCRSKMMEGFLELFNEEIDILPADGAGMGGDQHVSLSPEWRGWRERFPGKDIQSGARQRSGFKSP